MATKDLLNFRDLREKSGMTVAELADYLEMSVRQVRRYEVGESKAPAAVVRVLRAEAALRPHQSGNIEPKFRFIDLFAGIGGMRKGFEAIGGECVFTCEWDRYSQQTYRANFPGDGHEIAGDIREVREADIPVHDVLLAGFPCQPFSIAGVSKKNALNRPHGFACG